MTHRVFSCYGRVIPAIRSGTSVRLVPGTDPAMAREIKRAPTKPNFRTLSRDR
jgi:hypothetical protein